MKTTIPKPLYPEKIVLNLTNRDINEFDDPLDDILQNVMGKYFCERMKKKRGKPLE